jgi:hypothetical protein
MERHLQTRADLVDATEAGDGATGGRRIEIRTEDSHDIFPRVVHAAAGYQNQRSGL